MAYYDIIIIGAGFSGCSAAYTLSRTGKSIAIIDAGDVASGASGNEMAHVVPYITSPNFVGHELYNKGFQYTGVLLEALHRKGQLPSFRIEESVQFAINDRPKRMIERLRSGDLNCEEVSLHKANGGHPWIDILSDSCQALYPKTFVLDPREFCKALLNESTIDFIPYTKIEKFNENPKDNLITLSTNDEILQCKTLILANAADINQLQESIKLKIVQGQVCVGHPRGDLEQITLPLCFNGYYLPSKNKNQLSLLGATYEHRNFQTEPTEENNNKIIHNLSLLFRNNIPDGKVLFDPIRSRISNRAVTKDHLPLCGKISENIYILAGHGSRGLHTAPIGAELLYFLISGKIIDQDLQLSEDLLLRFASLLSPSRATAAIDILSTRSSN